jgi:predicted nucleotide-binding protein (sugar kinase/HSP70/actin superfamily)
MNATNPSPKPIITFARWGNYTIVFKALFDQLGLEVIPPEPTNSATIAEGVKISPEMYCFPLKATLGNVIPSLRKGANTVFMVQNIGGSCRQRYYGVIQEKVLKDHKKDFWSFDLANNKSSSISL